MIRVSAPGKIILLGEHAVVYDKLGIAGAIDKRIPISVDFGKDGINIIQISQYKGFRRSKEEVFNLLEKFRKFYQEKKFDEIKKLTFNDAITVVLGEIFDKYGFKDLDITITVKESVGNIGQSASIFSGIALAVTTLLNQNLSKKEISDIAYLGEVVAHGGTPSGIDNSIVTYGGYITYKRSEGVKPLELGFEIPLLVVDTGEPARTGETVPYIRKQREENQKFVDFVLDNLDKISHSALGALKSQDLVEIGKLMIKYYEELSKLKISTSKLDEIIDLAIKNKALGAKPTGGWGGGSVIILAENNEKLKPFSDIFKRKGFRTLQTKLGAEGVRLEK